MANQVINSTSKLTKADALSFDQAMNLVNRLFADGKTREATLFLLGCNFGLRISDLLTLKWKHIVGVDSFRIEEKKTSKIRSIEICPELQLIILKLFKATKAKKDSLIFANRSGDKAISVQYINRQLKTIRDDYGLKIDNISSHTLRKTFGRQFWISNGRNDEALIFLSGIFGHADVSTTRTYLGIRQDDIKLAMANMMKGFQIAI